MTFYCPTYKVGSEGHPRQSSLLCWYSFSFFSLITAVAQILYEINMRHMLDSTFTFGIITNIYYMYIFIDISVRYWGVSLWKSGIRYPKYRLWYTTTNLQIFNLDYFENNKIIVNINVFLPLNHKSSQSEEFSFPAQHTNMQTTLSLHIGSIDILWVNLMLIFHGVYVRSLEILSKIPLCISSYNLWTHNVIS